MGAKEHFDGSAENHVALVLLVLFVEATRGALEDSSIGEPIYLLGTSP